MTITDKLASKKPSPEVGWPNLSDFTFVHSYTHIYPT